MDKVNMSLEEIIKMDNVKRSSPPERVPLESCQSENQDLTNCNSEMMLEPHEQNYTNGQNKMKIMRGPYWNQYGRSERRGDSLRNYAANRNNPYGPSRRWNNQRGNYRMFYKTGFKAFRGHGRRNNYNWNYYNNNSNLTERSVYHFNQINHGGGTFRRSASVSDVNHSEGPPYMRNGFVRAGSVTSLHSGHSVRSNVSYHSQRSNKSMRSNYSNASNRSNRSYRSNYSTGSHYSNNSNHNQGNFQRYFNGYRKWPAKRFRFYLNFDLQREIKKIQVEGQRVRQNSPMLLTDQNVETLQPIVMATPIKLTDRFSSNNA